jgi:predicted RecB family endonuclease
MRTVIYYQGFNRIENRNIIRLEQAKLNRLLDEERRVIETLIGSIKQQIEAAPHRLFDVRLIWNKLNNHTIVQSIRQKINLLTDAYPQFLSQVIAMHRRLEEKAIETLQVVRQIAQKSILCQ